MYLRNSFTEVYTTGNLWVDRPDLRTGTIFRGALLPRDLLSGVPEPMPHFRHQQMWTPGKPPAALAPQVTAFGKLQWRIPAPIAADSGYSQTEFFRCHE